MGYGGGDWFGSGGMGLLERPESEWSLLFETWAVGRGELDFGVLLDFDNFTDLIIVVSVR